MDSFEGINEFVTVAERQGFSAAARQLGCSTSHVSRQVSRLEARLGSALFARSTRMVSLTQAGLSYYRTCKELVSGLQLANEQVSSQHFSVSGVLRVSAAGSFAEQFVAPALMQFALQYPDLSIELDFNSRIVNFVEDGIDFALRYGRLSDSGLVARKLVDRPMMAAASPEYLAQNGTPVHPIDLKNHRCIISNNDQWSFAIGEQVESVRVHGRWKSNNANAVVQACERALGVAYLPKTNFSAAIARGTLVPVMEPYWSRGSSSWIVYQNRRFLPLRARLAIDYLLKHFSGWQE